MSPSLLHAGTQGLELFDWDRQQLRLLDGRAGPLEELRVAIHREERKIGQETLQRQLLALFSGELRSVRQ